MFQRNLVKEIRTHILCPVTSFSENFAVYDIMWKYMVHPDSPQMII